MFIAVLLISYNWVSLSANYLNNANSQMKMALKANANKDYVEEASWLMKSSDNGNKLASVNLAIAHLEGRGVKKDREKSISILNKVANKGYALAQNRLGQIYDTGMHAKQDYKQAVKWYQKSASQEDAKAKLSLKSLEKKITNADTQNAIAWMYSNGKDIAKDDKKAFMWHQKAANQDHANSQNSLGYMYDSGKGVEQSYDQAFMWFKKSANQDDAMAQSNLAEKYEKGQGTNQDYKQAIKWYQKAADQDYSGAQSGVDGIESKIADANTQNSLGDMYYFNKDVAKDYKQAVKWFKKAANQGHANAQNNMGFMYEHGKGIKQSYLMAVEYYRLSAKNGHEKGIEMANSVLLDSIDLGPISKKMTDELYMTKTYSHVKTTKDVKNLSQKVKVYMVGITGFFGADKYFSYTMQLNESGQIVDTKLLTDSWTYNTLLPPGDGKDMAEFIGEVLWEGGKMYIDVQSSYINDDSANLIYFKAFPGNEYKGYTITKDSITKTVKFYGVNDDGKSEWVIMEFKSMKSLINHNSCELSKFVVNSNAGGWLEVRPFEVNCEFNKMLTN